MIESLASTILSAVFLALTISSVQSQAPKDFLLPTLTRADPPKPTISPELAHYFQLPDAGARRFVSSYFPGLVPPPNFEIADPQGAKSPLSGLLTGGGGGNGLVQLQQTGALNGATGQIASSALHALLGNGNGGGAGALASLSPGFSVRPANSGLVVRSGNDTDDNDTLSSSQISGIPKIFPTLPRAPVAQPPAVLPSLPTRPAVPEGGLGPLASLTGASSSFGSGLSPQAPGSPFLPGSGLQAAVPNLPLSQATFAQQQQAGPSSVLPQASVGNDNLISQLLRTFGLNSLAPNLDLSAVNSVLGLSAATNPNTNPGILSNVVYSALTDSNVQTSPSSSAISAIGGGPLGSALGNASEIVNNKANAALIQNLLTQPNSPLCNPKPEPVETFNLDAFMGKWYQVLYSPPLSAGPCSMVTCKYLRSERSQFGPCIRLIFVLFCVFQIRNWPMLAKAVPAPFSTRSSTQPRPLRMESHELAAATVSSEELAN